MEFLARLERAVEVLEGPSDIVAALRAAWKEVLCGGYGVGRDRALEVAGECWRALHGGRTSRTTTSSSTPGGGWGRGESPESTAIREAYGICSCIAALAGARQTEAASALRLHQSPVGDCTELYRPFIRELDLAALISTPSVRTLAIDIIESWVPPRYPKCLPIPGEHKRNRAKHEALDQKELSSIRASSVDKSGPKKVEVCDCPSVSAFYRFMEDKVPVVIQRSMEDWPALELWRDHEYLLQVAGHRYVPVELGGEYASDSCEVKILSMEDFIQNHIRGTGGGYLAQHELLEQIPCLRKDVIVPDYTALLLPDEEESESDCVAVNAWFGPGGTVSTCHRDPYHNLLCQVVGSKCVHLFDSRYSSSMYPRNPPLSNTSQIDVLKEVDEGKFPLFGAVPRFVYTLKEGDMLYIPPLWWHCVISREVSFSLSFWWGKERRADPS